MTWTIEFHPGVEETILEMPPGIQARILRLLELMEVHGANLGAPHTIAMGGGLFEVRAKAKEGIGRALFCYVRGRRLVILHAFVKKTQKTPKKELGLARARMKEITFSD